MVKQGTHSTLRPLAPTHPCTRSPTATCGTCAPGTTPVKKRKAPPPKNGVARVLCARVSLYEAWDPRQLWDAQGSGAHANIRRGEVVAAVGAYTPERAPIVPRQRPHLPSGARSTCARRALGMPSGICSGMGSCASVSAPPPSVRALAPPCAAAHSDRADTSARSSGFARGSPVRARIYTGEALLRNRKKI